MPGTHDDHLLNHIRAYLAGSLPSYEGGSMEDYLLEYLRGTLPSYQAGSSGYNAQGDYIGGPFSFATGAATIANYQNSLAGGGGGGGAGGAGGAQLPYQPEAPKTQALIDPLAEAGKGLLDPGSQYTQRLQEQMTGAIGQQTAAQGRGAVLQASRAGFGTGAGAELLETQGDISRGGLAAQGQAGANLALQAPGMGAQMMQPALSAQLGLQGQGLQAYMGQQQIGAQQSAQQSAQQFQGQLQQQQLEQQKQAQEAQMQMQAQQMKNDMEMREMGLLYS